MKKHLTVSAVALLTGVLTGCGSDNSPTPPPPPVTEPTKPQLENVFGTPDPEMAKTSNAYVSIASKIIDFQPDYTPGRFSCQRYGGDIDCNNVRAHGQFIMKDGRAVPTAGADDVMNKSKDVFQYEYLLEKTNVNLAKQGYSESIRPDVFNDGYASLLDVLLVTAKQYDLDVEISYDTDVDTYWIDSIEGITGMDRSWMPADEDLKVPFGECTAPGGWKAVYSVPLTDANGGVDHKLEEVYHRLDEFYMQSGGAVHFIPMCKEERDLRKGIYLAEQQRIAENGGKVIIPKVILNFEWDRTAVFNDVEVKAYNQRNDIFKPGVLTHMDMLLSLQEHAKGLEVNFNVWPILSNGTPVNGYVMNYLTLQGLDDEGVQFDYGHQSDGVAGWNYHGGEFERVNDAAYGLVATFRGAHCNIELTGQEGKGSNDAQSIRMTLPGSPCTGGDWRPGSGSWQTPLLEETVGADGDISQGPVHMGLVPYGWGKESPIEPLGFITRTSKVTGKDVKVNRSYYPTGFGGNALHILPDVLTMHNPEYFEFYMNSFMGGTEEFMQEQAKTGKSNTIVAFELEETLPPELQYSAKDIADAVAPLDEQHFGWGLPDCTGCHKEGANKSHMVDELKPFECAECHGSNGAPEGHGEQNTCGFCHAETLKLHGNAYQASAVPEDGWNPVTDPFAGSGYQAKAAEYWGLHTNFPEAASCMTCHPSDNDRHIKRK